MSIITFAMLGAGAILLWAGITGQNPWQGLQDVLAGKKATQPAAGTAAAQPAPNSQGAQP